MRDYLFLAILFSSLPFCFARPYFGILMWSWVSFMSPQRFAWTLSVRFFSVGQYIGAATLAGFLLTRDRERLPVVWETVMLLIVWAFYTLTSFTALTDFAWDKWSQTTKILLFIFLSIVLCMDRKKIKTLMLVVAFSIGFYGFKGTIFSFTTGGEFLVWGPEATFIEDNNDLGLALLMVTPIFLYLARVETNKRLRVTLYVFTVSAIVATLFTYSRGAFLGVIALMAVLILKSNKKLPALFLVVFGIIAMLLFAPEKWFGRMNSIDDYKTDGSAMGRLNAWRFAINLALDRPFVGGGFNASQRYIFERYAPDPYDFHSPHSIYFEVLGEHGFPGLILFMLLLFGSIMSMRTVKKTYRYIPSMEWVVHYSDMIQLSLIAYMVSGAFLGRAYFDLYYQILGFAVIVKTLAKREYEELYWSSLSNDGADWRLLSEAAAEPASSAINGRS